MAKKNGSGTEPARASASLAGGEPLEKPLWKSADKLRKNIDAAEYKHVAIGLIFLKYISDAFEELYDKLKAGEGLSAYDDAQADEYAGADPENKDAYKAEFEAQLKKEADLNARIAQNLNKIQMP